MKPITTEKAIRLIEAENTLIFEVDRRLSRTEIKKQIEESFNVKIDSVNVLIRDNRKYAYTRLNKKNPAIDVATKLGMI
ncbi:MAG: 50S ribosomal protein L23 [Candidatus Nanoarchaeia archaeon]|nr:50S ribosomal protein L23 [Candidatus Nanoarchaeia archaeon]MDD5741712.1 50S ribosomal protein L23 [Candidatus Nanoarchaeia archaeon]